MQGQRLQRRAPAAAPPRRRPAREVPAPSAPAKAATPAASAPRHRIGELAGGRSGLPERLRSGIEALSGVSMAGVSVHYDSPHPERVGALAYARGREIHLARGQEAHLPHEAWHLVQQARGRVRALGRVGRTPLNDDPMLEREADRMGERARAFTGPGAASPAAAASASAQAGPPVTQRVLRVEATGRRNRGQRRQIVGQLNAMLPAGVRAGIDRRTGHVRLNGPAPVGPHAGYDLVNRMIGHGHTVRITPTDTNAGGVIRGRPENPQAPGLRADPGGWARHHWYGFLGNFSENYRSRQAFAAAADPTRGADHQIFYDPKVAAQNRQVAVHDPGLGRTVTETAARETILAHELIHADRTQRGVTSATPQGFSKMGAYNYTRGPPPGGAPWFDPLNPTHDQELEELEEMEAVGLPSAPAIKPMFQPRSQRPDFVHAAAHVPNPANITENQIRAQLGRRNRSKYRR